jgi:hypothetical protein
MKATKPAGLELSKPELATQTQELGVYLSSLKLKEIQSIMGVSANLAHEIMTTASSWPAAKDKGSALHSFRGDVFSGLQVASFDKKDLAYASQNLKIVSGLYGLLRPLDAVAPYRLEMGYKLTREPYVSLYKFWVDSLAKLLPAGQPIINLTSLEYGRAVVPYLDKSLVISPRFYTYNAKTRQYTSVAVHSKIARGSFAHWLITQRINKVSGLINFDEIGYHYEASLSTPLTPAFVCRDFMGKGLSVRLK